MLPYTYYAGDAFCPLVLILVAHPLSLRVFYQAKAEAAAKKKAEKEMAKAAAAVATTNEHKQKYGGKKQDDEEELDPAQYFANRVSSLEALTTSSGLNAYPHKFHVTLSIPSYIERYCDVADGSKLEEENSSLAGRIMAKRGQGKLYFYEVSESLTSAHKRFFTIIGFIIASYYKSEQFIIVVDDCCCNNPCS